MSEKGWKYLGADRVMKLSPYKRAKSYEVFDKLTPHFATIGLSVEETIAVKLEFLAGKTGTTIAGRDFCAVRV